MLPIFSVSVSPLRPLLIRTFPLPRKVIFKWNLAQKLWLVYTIFSAIILLHLPTQSSKNYSLISLHVFTLKSSIISPTNTPRMMNQTILLTPPFLHFFSDGSTDFFKYLNIFLFFMQLQTFYHNWRVQNIQKGRRPRTNDDPGEGSKTYITQKPPASASSSNCSRLSWTVQAGNSRSHYGQLKLVNWL